MQDGSKKEGSDQNLQKGASEGLRGGALQENMPSQWGREFGRMWLQVEKSLPEGRGCWL